MNLVIGWAVIIKKTNKTVFCSCGEYYLSDHRRGYLYALSLLLQKKTALPLGSLKKLKKKEFILKGKKFKMLRLVWVLVLVENGFCWKPVVGPSSFSHLTNHHPVMGTHNTIIEGGEGAASSGHSVTYHGNIFTKQHEAEPEELLLNAEPGLDLEDVQGRVLSGHGSDYDSKFLDGSGLATLGEVN